jgi:hypothetical protein
MAHAGERRWGEILEVALGEPLSSTPSHYISQCGVHRVRGANRAKQLGGLFDELTIEVDVCALSGARFHESRIHL